MERLLVAGAIMEWTPETHLLRVVTKEGPGGTGSERDFAKRTLDKWIEDGADYCVLLNGSNGPAPTVEAQAFWTTFFARVRAPKRMAVCGMSPAGRRSVEAWEQTVSFPMRLFEDEKTALDWVSG